MKDYYFMKTVDLRKVEVVLASILSEEKIGFNFSH